MSKVTFIFLLIIASAVLTHRYSFNDGSVSDSVGGTSWTGTLGSTASVSGGQLRLPGGSVSSYLQLPAGILGSPAPASVTIEMWVTTGSSGTSTNYARLLQFGSTFSSSNNANSYMFGRDSGNNGYLFFSYSFSSGVKSVFQNNVAFDGMTNAHIVIVLNNNGPAIIYINNVPYSGT
jgi:hypothetical protein